MPDRPEDKKAQDNLGIDLEGTFEHLTNRNRENQIQNERTPAEHFGDTGVNTTTHFSETEKEELADKGADFHKAWQDNFNYEKTMADLQSGSQQLGRAVFGGIYKGALSAVENVGYIADFEEWMGIADEMDKGYTNWLSEAAKAQKESTEGSTAIYAGEEGSGLSSGDIYQGAQSIIDSVVGFAGPGAGVGKAIGYGTKIVGFMMKAGALPEALVTQMGTALATNYMESKMMASELYNNTYNRALREGISHEEASSIAKKNADDFIWQNKIMFVTDAVAARHLLSGRALTTGAAEKTWKGALMEGLKDAGAEAGEEMYSGFVQKENERDAAIELGLDKEDGSSYFDRAVSYLGDEGWKEGLLGALGGPLQGGALKLSSKAVEKIADKMGIPDPEMPARPTDSKELPAWEEKVREITAMKNIGRKFQAVRDVRDFMQKENELQKAYTQAVLDGDSTKIKDIENQRFEGLYLRYAKRNSAEALEERFKEVISDPQSSKEEKEKAQKYLNRMPELQQDYLRAFNKFGKKGLTNQMFQATQRLKSSKEVLTDLNQTMENKKLELANTVKQVEGKDISPVQQELLALKIEQAELDKIKNQLGVSFNPKMAMEFSRKQGEYENRIAQLKKEQEDTWKRNEEVHSWIKDDIKTSELKQFKEFEEFEKTAKDKANAWASYKAYENLYNHLTSDNLQKDIHKQNLEYLNDQLDKVTSKKDIEVLTRQAGILDLSPSQRRQFEKHFDVISKGILSEEERLTREAERKQRSREYFDDIYKKAGLLIEKAHEEPTKENIQDAESIIDEIETLESIEEEYVPEEEISPEESGNLSNNEKEEEKKENFLRNDHPWVIAYASYSGEDGGYAVKKNTLTDWIEQNPEVDKIGTEIRFEVSKDDIGIIKDKDADSAIKKILAGDGKLSDKEIAGIHIRQVLYKDGKPLTIGDQPIFGWLRSGWFSKYETDKEEKTKKVIAQRKRILAAILKGGVVKTKITQIGGGLLKSEPGVINNPKKYLGKINLLMSDGKTGLVRGKFNEDRLLYDESKESEAKKAATYNNVPGNTTGFIFAETMRPNGTHFPLKLNSRKIEKEEIDVLYKLTKAIVKGKSFSEEVTDIDQIKGLSYMQAIKLLVYQGEYSLNKKYPFWIDTKNNLVHVKPYDKVVGIPFNEIGAAEDLLKDYFSKLWRTTDSSLINKTFSSKIKAEKFEWFGRTIDSSMDYNDFLFEEEALTSNATFPNGRLFINPYIMIENPEQWEVEGIVDTKPKPASAPKETPVAPKAVSSRRQEMEQEIAEWERKYRKAQDRVKGLDQERKDLVEERWARELIVIQEKYKDVENEPEVKEEVKPEVKDQSSLMDRLKQYSQGGKADPIVDDDVLPSIFKGRTEKIDIQSEMEWLEKNLPNVPKEVRLGLLQRPGGYAEGIFVKGLIVLSDQANKGVAYHEAFHAVSQMYLTEEKRAELYNEARAKYDSAMTDIQVEEVLAEEFREYMLTKGELSVPPLFKWLYDLIKDLVNLFKSSKHQIFNRIRRGQFAYEPIQETTKTFYSRGRLAKFPIEMQKSAVDLITYLTVKESGLLHLDSPEEVEGDSLAEVFEKVKATFSKTAIKLLTKFEQEQANPEVKEDETDREAAENYANVLDHWEDFLPLVKDQLKIYELVENNDEEDKQDAYDDYAEEENFDDYNKDTLNIKTALQHSGKDNATGTTKAMLALLPTHKGNKDPYFKSIKFAEFSRVWAVLTENLSGMVEDSKTSLPDKMLNKIKELTSDFPELNGLVKMLESQDFPAYKKTLFYSAMSNQPIDYSMTLLKDLGKGKYETIIANADVQNQSNQIREGWLEGFKISNINSEGKLKNRDRLEFVVNEFKEIKRLSALMAQGKQEFLDGVFTELTGILNVAGITVSEKALRAITYQYKKHNAVAKKFDHIINSLSYVILKSDKGVSLEGLLENDWSDEKNFIKNNTFTKQLARVEAMFSNIPGEGMVIGPDGNRYYTKSQNNYLSKTIARWKAEPEIIDNLLSKLYHKKSLWLKKIKEDMAIGKDKFKMKVYLSHRIDKPSDQGDGFTDLSRPDEAIDRIERTLTGTYSPLTFADKSSFYQFSGIPVEEFDTSWNGDVVVSEYATKMIYNYFLAEYERIAWAFKDPKTVEVYKDAAKKFYIFPEFNPGTALAKELGLFDETGMPSIDVDKDQTFYDKVKLKLADSIKKQIKETKDKLVELGITDNGTTYIQGISESIKRKYYDKNRKHGDARDLSTSKTVYDIIGDFTINSIISNIEFTMMFSGDPAFYKDLPKRTPETIATGADPISSGLTKFRIAVVNDIEKESTLYGEYFKIFEKKFGAKTAEILKPYGSDLNHADAQAWIRPERFRSIMVMLGKWQPKHEAAYQRLIVEGKPVNPKDLKIMQPLKGMLYEMREDGQRMIPTYLKYSQAVLWPSLVKDTKLEKVLNRMNNDKIDEIVFKSGIKVGAEAPGNIEEVMEGGGTLTPITLSNFNWKLQQDLPAKYHKKGKSLVGSQVRKNIIANLAGKTVKLNGKDISGTEMIKLVNQVESQLSDLGKQNIEREWGVKNGRITNFKKVYERLKEKFKKDEVSSNIIEQLNNDAPLDTIFQYKEKIEQELHAMITKSTVRLEAPGGAFIQMSGVGFATIEGITQKDIDPNGIIWLQDNKELVGPRLIDGRVIPGQVLLPFSAVKDIPGFDKMSIAELRSALGDTITNLVGYRIPNQGTSSIDVFDIAGILPPSSGDSIVTYTEITGKTGSDYDIDKMFVIMPHVIWNKDKKRLERISSVGDSKAALENRRLELWSAILSSPDVFPELVRPLDSGWLKDDAYYIALLNEIREKGYPKGMDKKAFFEMSVNDRKKWATSYYKNPRLSNLQFFSPMYQLDLKTKNIAGKNGVGQTANHLVDHVLAQSAGLYWKGNLFGELSQQKNETLDYEGQEVNTLVTDLSHELSLNGEQITQVISAWLNAYVDNAKDPYISLINNNTYTAHTVFLMLRAGMNPEWVNRFMSQPGVSDLSNYYFNIKSKLIPKDYEIFRQLKVNPDTGELGSTEPKRLPLTNIDLAFRKWGGWKQENLQDFDPSEIIIEKLEEQILNPTPEFQKQMMMAFLKFNWAATKLNESVRATKSDTQGATGGAAENLAARELKKKVEEEGFIGNFQYKFVNREGDSTMIGSMYNNSVEFSNEIFSKEFISKLPAVQRTIKRIHQLVGNDYATDADLSKKIISSLYTYLYSDSYMLRANQQQIKDLFYGENSMGRRVARIKKNFPDNILLKTLTTKTEYDNSKPSFVGMNTKKKDKIEMDNLWLKWDEMLRDESEVEEGYMMKDFAEDLIKYSFYSSGFSKGLYSFYDLIPHTYMKGDYSGVNSSFNKYVGDLPKKLGGNIVLEDFIDQFFRHNSFDYKLVPTFKGEPVVIPGVSLEDGFAINKESLPENINIGEAIVSEHSKPDPSRYVLREDGMFRYAGYYKGMFYYERVEPLGHKEKGYSIFEYQFGKNPRSIVNSSASPGLPDNLKSVLQDGIETGKDSTFQSYSEKGNTIVFPTIDYAKFTVHKYDSAFSMDVEFNGSTFSVATGQTWEEARDKGVNVLRGMGKRDFDQTLKTRCK
jgi:hypothetical protein